LVKTTSLLRYEKRFETVIDHIYTHLGDDLDLDRLAEVANMSVYHWHRVYRAMTGESVVATVKRLRLHQSADKLANSDASIVQIARECGYPNVQSFTRIFRDVYGLSPDKYRKNGSHTRFKLKLVINQEGEHMYPVEIVDLDVQRGVGIYHLGSYMEIGKAFEKLYVALNSRHLLKGGERVVGVYFDDPALTPETELRAIAGVVGVDAVSQEGALAALEISAGKYAKLSYTGPYADMHSAYQWLYSEWLAQSDYELGQSPCFEEYLNSPQNTAPADLKTDIYLSLAP